MKIQKKIWLQSYFSTILYFLLKFHVKIPQCSRPPFLLKLQKWPFTVYVYGYPGYKMVHEGPECYTRHIGWICSYDLLDCSNKNSTYIIMGMWTPLAK